MNNEHEHFKKNQLSGSIHDFRGCLSDTSGHAFQYQLQQGMDRVSLLPVQVSQLQFPQHTADQVSESVSHVHCLVQKVAESRTPGQKRRERASYLASVISKKKEPDPEEDPTFIRGFRLVSVFDLSQTYGSEEHLPLIITGLRHSVKGEEEIYEELRSNIPLKIIEVEHLSSKGIYNLSSQGIRIRSDLSTVKKTKALIHEYTQNVHHTSNKGQESCF